MNSNLIVGKQKSGIPDLIQKVTAYRTFSYDDFKLISPSQRVIWNTSRKQNAKCEGKDHSAPNEKCTCGLYGFKNLEHIKNNTFYKKQPIIAVTEHWGKTIVHEDGLRSQYAAIKAISAPGYKKEHHYAEDMLLCSFIFIILLVVFLTLSLTSSFYSSLPLTIFLGVIYSAFITFCFYKIYDVLFTKFNKIILLNRIKRSYSGQGIIICKNLKELEQHHTHPIS